jgi:hypothetical protein
MVLVRLQLASNVSNYFFLRAPATGRLALIAWVAPAWASPSYSASHGAPATERLTGHGVDTPLYEARTFLPAVCGSEQGDKERKLLPAAS